MFFLSYYIIFKIKISDQRAFSLIKKLYKIAKGLEPIGPFIFMFQFALEYEKNKEAIQFLALFLFYGDATLQENA